MIDNIILKVGYFDESRNKYLIHKYLKIFSIETLPRSIGLVSVIYFEGTTYLRHVKHRDTYLFSIRIKKITQKKS